ncbi:MAG: hypothetical protein JWQ78_338 [Sediminibacterium sp.]|nr:hypothetical protein [Sediminibacterium sp.]
MKRAFLFPGGGILTGFENRVSPLILKRTVVTERSSRRKSLYDFLNQPAQSLAAAGL